MDKYYIASSFQNKTIVKELSQKLKKLGYLQTYNWTINNKAETKEQLVKIGKDELKGISDSDFLIVVLPGGKGTHVELGIALSQNKPIYIYSQDSNMFNPSNSCTFYHLPNVKIVTGEIVKLINTLEADFNI
ncbi:nucleoside 2-deoxyribosyltransferase [Staphylococcus succinus]|uniref:Group-specific protein n=1 Tax=Staphylococcus succinus TaxID=61015 RepID=A0A9Q6HMC4_9STAP|nr:nucleoside 2-deoxyribosyltransferase [Staphylococcus succinus]PTI73807.1 group-specific protein [Staphylococcus succinus]